MTDSDGCRRGPRVRSGSRRPFVTTILMSKGTPVKPVPKIFSPARSLGRVREVKELVWQLPVYLQLRLLEIGGGRGVTVSERSPRRSLAGEARLACLYALLTVVRGIADRVLVQAVSYRPDIPIAECPHA